MIEMKQDKISLKNGFDKFIVHCKVKNLSDMTIRYYKDGYGFFTAYLEKKDIYLENINKKMIDNYVLYMRSQGLRDTTINTRIRSIRAILYFLMEEGDLGYFKIKLIVQTQENKKLYTDKEIEKLLKKPNKKKCTFAEFRTWALENFLVATGVRSRSARNVKIEDLDFENDLIYIDTVKNRKPLVIPMSIALKKVVIEYLAIRKGSLEDYVFCNLEGKQLTKDALNNIISKYNKQRGVEKTGVHLFRHYYAKNYIQNGGDCLKLQKLLGHTTLEMTKIYVELYGNDLQKDYNKFNPLDVLIGNTEKIKMRGN